MLIPSSQSIAPPVTVSPLVILNLILKTFFFCLFRATSEAYGGSQTRGQIGAVAADLCHTHSNARSELCLQPIAQLTVMPDP